MLIIMGSMICMQAIAIYISAHLNSSGITSGYQPDGTAQDAIMADQAAHAMQSVLAAKETSYLAMIIGVIPLLCGLLVYRYPLASTTVGCGLVILLYVKQAVANPASLVGGGVLGILLKAGILAALTFAIKEAVEYRRALREYLSRAPNA